MLNNIAIAILIIITFMKYDSCHKPRCVIQIVKNIPINDENNGEKILGGTF